MEEKDREFKRARTVRTDYKHAVDEVQSWIQNAEVKVQDRSVEPLQLKENLSQIQSEICDASDKLDCLTKSGHLIMSQTNKEEERDLIQSTVRSLTEHLAQVRSWLEEKKLQVGEAVDSWQRFMALYTSVKSWVDEKQTFLLEPLQLSSLTQTRQKLHDYTVAVKSCKQVSRNISEMSKELEAIGQVTNVGELPGKLQEVEEAKVEVENQLLERNALLQETGEEWEQCEKKMKDVRSCMDKFHQALESPQNKKRPLRDQLGIREKMVTEISMQKSKLAISVEKLQLHFRTGVIGDSKITEAAEEIIRELDQLTGVVKEQTASLEACLAQLDQYQQEIQQLRQQIIQVEQQLRVVLSPTYLPQNRDKAVEEQNVSLTSDVIALKQSVDKAEVEFSCLPADDLTSMLATLVKLLDDIQLKEREAIKLEMVLRDLPPDAETQSLEATLARLRTQIVTLMSKIEQGKTLVELALGVQEKRRQEVLQYEKFLTDLEQWLGTVNVTLRTETRPASPKAIRDQLLAHEKLSVELNLKETQLLELASHCEGLQGYPDIQQLAVALSEHIQPVQEAIREAAKELKIHHDMLQCEPAAEAAVASDTSAVPSEVPVQSQIAAEVEMKKEPVVLDVESQTGNSLLFDHYKNDKTEFLVSEVTTKDEGTICSPPVDMEVQTELSGRFGSDIDSSVAAKKEIPPEVAVQTASDAWTSPAVEMQKNKIHVFQKKTENEETIEIATKAGIGRGESLVVPTEESDVLREEKDVNSGDDLLVEVKYKGQGQEDSESVTSTSELHIVHSAPQSFETVLVDPDESTTEVIVDKDGNQKIVVRKVRRIVISQQQQQHTVQQRLQTFTSSDTGGEYVEVPVTQSLAFSQVTLQGQQKTVSENQGDGMLHVTTTQSYVGNVLSGIPGGDQRLSEFSAEPQHQTVSYHTVSGEIENLTPPPVLLKGIEIQEVSGDGCTVVEPSEADVSAELQPEHAALSQPEDQGTDGDGYITTSSSCVHAVVEQVTRKVVRRIRRVVRHVVVIDGKEHVTEEVVEEPEEIEVTEEVPRVRVEVSRTGGHMGQQILDFDLQKQYEQHDRSDVPGQEHADVPRESHHSGLQESENCYGNVISDLEGKLGTEIQDVHLVKELPSGQKELTEGGTVGQSPVEKQEHTQREEILLMTAPGLLHEGKEETAENNYVNRVSEDTLEEVLMRDSVDAKTVLATAEELEEEVSKVLPDTGESLVQDKSVVETDAEESSSLEVTGHHAASDFDTDHSVIPVVELIEKDVFGNVAPEEEKLHIMTGTEEVLPNSSSVFEPLTIKFEVFEPKTESEYVISELKTREDFDVTQTVREHTSEMAPENVESPCITQREAIATVVTDIPIASSSDMVVSLESGILPGLEKTEATQESYSYTVVTELEGQGIAVHYGEAEKYIDSQSQGATAGENIIEETASICELGDAKGAVMIVTSEKTVGSENTEKLHMTVDDGHAAVSQSEPLRITGVGTSELSEDEYFTSGIVGKSVMQSAKPSKFQETLMESDVGVSKDVTSQTSPEHGVKTIEFALSLKEKPKTSFQQPSELAEVSAAVKVEEKELTPLSEEKRDEPCTGTVPEHKIVQENIEIEFPGTKTVSCTVTEETVTCTGPAPTSLKTDSEARDDISMKSEAEISMLKKSRRRKKHKAKGLEESSPEVPVEAEQVDTPEQTPRDAICDVQREVQTSLETSLAESTEIIIPGSSASSSDTTKPTEQEDIMMLETPISPPSPRDSEMTHDTGYDPEDKTTLDEISVMEEGDTRKNKKKKKKKQKVKAKDLEESTPVFQKSSIEPVVGQPVVILDVNSTEKDEPSKEIIREVQGSEPDEATIATSDTTAEKVTVEERGTERKGKKRKKDGKGPDVASEFKEPSLALNVQLADMHSPEFHDDSYRELKSEEVDSVKVIDEAVATRPPSEAVEAVVDSEPQPVEVWELLHVQEQSAQTVTPDIPKSPDAMVESSVQTSSEHVAVTCEDYAQTMTPEMHVIEKTETADFSVQTVKEDLTSTQEECVQTKTPEVVDVGPVVTGEISIQTSETEPATTHDEAAQTSTPEATELVAVDSMESSIQTKTEEIVPVQEDSVQTLTPEVPVTDTKDSSVQAIHTDLTPMLEGSVQTVTPEPTEIPELLKVETFETSIQTSKELLDPACGRDVDTVAEKTPLQTVEISSQTVEEYSVETQEGTAQTVSPEVAEIKQTHTFDTSIQTLREELIPTASEYSQTVPSELPQVHTAEIAEISTQTTKMVPSMLEEYAQTLSPDVPDFTDTFIQTLKEELIPTEEQCSQTATVENFEAQNIEMADSSVWTVEEDIVKSAEFSPTVPPVVAKREEKAVFQSLLEPERTEMADASQMGEEDVIPTQILPETTVSHVLFIPIDTKVETAETSIQTKPVFVKEYGDERSQSSSSEEPYEIHVQASVSFTPSVESGDIGKIDYHTDRKLTSSGDNIGSGVCESEQDEDVCYTVETLLKSDDEKSAQFTRNEFGVPAVEEEPVIGINVNTDGNIEPDISDLAQTQLREDTKQAVCEFIVSEMAAELREREDKRQGVELEDQAVPNRERVMGDTAVTQLKCTEPEEEEYPSLEDIKLKQKELKQVQNLDGGSPEHIFSHYQEQTKSPESLLEPIDLEEAHLIPESSMEDASELKPETVTARIMNEKAVDEIVISTEPEVTTEMKLQHPEAPTSKKTEISEEHSEGQKSPADSKLVTSAELPAATQTLEHKSDVEIPAEFRQSYSDTAKLSSKPVDHMGTVFLTEDHKVSVQPVRGEHSPGPPVIHEEVVTIFSPDPSSCQEMEPTGPEPVSSSVNEQFLMEPHGPVVDINVESGPTYVKENISDFGTAERTQEKSVPLTSADVIPVATSEQFILQERSCSDNQVIQLRDSEDEMDLSKCKSPVMLEDISIQFEPKQPSDIISIADEATAVQWKKASSVLSGRLRDLHNARKTTHMSRGMYLVTLEEIVTEELVEQRSVHVQNNLSLLRSAVEKKDIVIIQKTIIETVETISVWLETIEYRIYLNRQKTNTAPTHEHMKEYDTLKEEINSIEVSVAALEGILETASGVGSEDDKIHLRECLASLQEHVKAVDEIAQESEEKFGKDLVYWEEFLNGVNNISVMVEELKQQLEELIQSDISVQLKLQELEKIESINRCHMFKTSCLLKTARSLIRDFPGRDIPPETFTAHETTRIIEHSIALERDRLLQLLSLADDYEQTLKEFSQIIDVADTLVDSPISVVSLEHLQEEMQKHRKFFVNLSHCRGILESLEGNLDPDTRALHSQLHQTLHCRATAILDKAASRAQQMALAASRWTVLEQGMKEERGWLQVAHQRVPDLQTVSSPEYDQYISLYQSLSSDVAVHHARIVQLLGVARRLQELVTCIGLEARYDEHLEVILTLQDDVNSNLRRLLAFRDTWSAYDLMVDKLEFWMKGAEKDLDIISAETVPPGGNMRQFWELKAQYELHDNIRNEAGTTFESAMRIIPVADEMLQRQFYSQLEDRWRGVADKINRIQASIIHNLSSQEVPFSDKLSLLEQELQEVKATISDIRGVIKNEEELNLYIKRLQVLHERVEHIQEELGRLGLLSATESEKVSALLYAARQVDVQVSEELEGSVVLRERLQAIQKGLARVKRNHERASCVLDQCEASEKLSSEVVEQAVINCQAVAEELGSHWQDLMTLRQLLHTLPTCLRVTVSPVKVEREISQLQDEHTALETRCDRLLSLLRARLALWKRFERQLEMVQQSVQEADYMMELLTVQGSVDYDRLLKATERLEGLYGSLDQREDLLDELRAAAEPLASSCDPEVSQKIEAAVAEAVTAWNDTCHSLLELCNRYQDAVRLWKQYREASEAVKAWADQQLDTVAQFKPEEALRQVKVCEETLAAHKSRLGELKGLVAQIANDVGLEAGGLLEAEVDALGKRLEDVRETLVTLAEVAETKAANRDLCTDDLLKTKTYLSSVQQSLTTVEESNEKDVENQLGALRNHLLALGRTEGQLQALKEKSVELAPARPETSVVEILQLWQQVFRETFQQYHRLSARLVKSQDGAAALRLWQEYLLHVQSFLSGSIPEDYHSLTEHQHLCEVHQNLLTTQQSVLLSDSDDPEGKLGKGLVELSVAEQFNSLTNLHNETLARIMERHGEVRERLEAWDRYRQDQARLLSWLRDTERERGKLQLRYIHTRRVPKMLQRIESLLEKVPAGESQAEHLQEQQSKLLNFCDDALATSIRMEHAAITQRISNLQAGLETWKDFLKRVLLLTATFEEQVNHIESVYREIHTAVTEPDVLPLSHTGMQNKLENLRLLRSRLVDLTRDLEELGVTQEQLKECVSPVDMKTVNQKVWLLWQGQGDLDHHLAILCHQLEEKLGLRTMFDSRQSRFLVWASDVESRVDKGSAAEDPEEVLRRLETELQAEVALKSREVDWLLHSGSELAQAYAGDGETEDEQRKEIEYKVQQVRGAWNRLQNLSKSRANKLHDILQTISQLEIRIAELRTWLYQMEAQLMKPLVFATCSKDVLEAKLQEHEELQKEIEKKSSSIADVLNLSELLLSDCASCKTAVNTESITVATEALEKRWKSVCGLSADMKCRILTVWALLEEVLRLSQEQQQWLESQEQVLKDMDSRRGQMSQDEIQDLISRVEVTIREIESHDPALRILDQSYTKLIKDSGLEMENLQQLTSVVRSTLLRWHQLIPTAIGIIERLRDSLRVYHDFATAHEAALVSLIEVNARLTHIQQLATPEELGMPRKRLQQIQQLESELEAKSDLLRNADELGLEVMKISRPDKLPAVQEMIDEYQLLWKDIMAQIAVLKTECQDEIQKKELEERTVDEVDESVQVETLRFEQDSAVQVDTLPPLTKLTSRDAYLYELETAIQECITNLNSLEDALHSPTPPQGSRSQVSSPQMPKLMATCQSSVELIGHLSAMLISESHVSEECARASEVRELTARYDDLVSQARAREQRIRESNESARLTCPLCSRRNWQQLDNDLWRLEQWLQFAEGTQGSQTAPPTHIEQLEDTIQDHREFLMDLESHKNIVVSLNIVGTHLADHTEDVERAEQLRTRLVTTNGRWDAVCRAAAAWQTKLQTALMENDEFHQIIEELVTWLEKTENVIRQAEPVDLTDKLEVIEAKYTKFRELRSDLERCEPRVMSLQEAADQLLRRSEGPESASTTWSRLTELRLKLQSLRRLTGVYILKLGAVLGKDTSELGMSMATVSTSGRSTAAASLMSLSQELLDQAAPGQFEGLVQSEHQHKNDSSGSEPDDVDTTVLARGYRFLGRVVRASLPIQALMLLLLGVAALVPTGEEDYSCILSNNFARSLEPMLRYPNGPPPI